MEHSCEWIGRMAQSQPCLSKLHYLVDVKEMEDGELVDRTVVNCERVQASVAPVYLGVPFY